ncbi:MAG TPA: DUF6513 domain-containing protein [Pirellulaceae bacterium]|nr:DUF6513 domain-containing protein [Pirellulaceae bacterium]HMO93333.1 DUF6513 domain-containing protein [Pirellulaceae bacterium]HMP70104.1 DUF6513 domain-containing protein [Pirellulaceae bacterium]
MTSPIKLLIVTGRLAENIVRKTVESLRPLGQFEFVVQVLPISVAALMTPEWIAKHIHISPHIDRVILPGYCKGDLKTLNERSSAAIEIGPLDVRDLGDYLLGRTTQQKDLTSYNIEILAEINHAPRLTREEVVSAARSLADAGADVIDLGCDVGYVWNDIGVCVKAIRDLGLRVSVDSFNPQEVITATQAGAELVLSVNSSNIQYASDYASEVVLIPDEQTHWHALESNIEVLDAQKIPFRIDPILEPVGHGFASSLKRYFDSRTRWPNVPILMGIGNLTELTEVDSAGLNFLLLAICQELNIRSVLTTQVINWARSSVKECEIARRLVHYSLTENALPKHVDSSLVLLRDAKLHPLDFAELAQLALNIKDWNMRIFADPNGIHLLGGGQHFFGHDVFQLFDKLTEANPKNLTPSHAFYLGYEMCKATIAMHLGKQYVQDESLNWGFLTVEESDRHRLVSGKSPSNPTRNPKTPGTGLDMNEDKD